VRLTHTNLLTYSVERWTRYSLKWTASDLGYGDSNERG